MEEKTMKLEGLSRTTFVTGHRMHLQLEARILTPERTRMLNQKEPKSKSHDDQSQPVAVHHCNHQEVVPSNYKKRTRHLHDTPKKRRQNLLKLREKLKIHRRQSATERKRQSNLKYVEGRPNPHAQHLKWRSPRKAPMMVPNTPNEVICWVLGEYGIADGKYPASYIIGKLCAAEAHSTDDTVKLGLAGSVAAVGGGRELQSKSWGLRVGVATSEIARSSEGQLVDKDAIQARQGFGFDLNEIGWF
ncbi:AP-4 complex subunit epsilon [Olea europaea subsp. europaea]|uniref:AP-4 complex subunit epsilon n=1 Tax=Olea europaea subsp. europaea TaxID=158383 RepID=A0A8S0RH49_OLEEU|nr:AP-4 complex subunit epsilon [Olea europaea subsp. europaea]